MQAHAVHAGTDPEQRSAAPFSTSRASSATPRSFVAAALSALAIICAPASSHGQPLAKDPLDAQVMAKNPLPPSAEADRVIAKVNGVDVHLSDLALAEEWLMRGLPRTDERAKRQTLLNYLSDAIILADEATKRKVANEEELARFQRRAEFTRDKALMDRLLLATAQASVTEDALREAYEENVKKTPPEPEIDLRAIICLFKNPKDEAAVKAAEDKANAALKRVKAGEDFATVAKELSENPSGQSNGGDLGYMTRTMMGGELANVAFTLDPGSVAGPIKTQFAWYVIKVEDKRTRNPPTFEAARDKYRYPVARKAQLDLIAKLRSEAKIEILDKDLDNADEAPPATPK
jgi:peptidyl-prolyl cis-trans isomerase C